MFEHTPIRLLPPVCVSVYIKILAEVQNYNHKLMNIPEVWKKTKGAGVKVAIVDTGLPKHYDLSPAGGDSFIEDYLEDKNGHATHCGGIIAAIANNGMGVCGIAPDVDDYYCAVMDEQGIGTVSTLIRGIYWAVDEVGADIINLSLGLPTNFPYCRELEDACAYAAKNNVTIFAAAGNDAGPVGQPAIYDCVYSVGAIDSHKKVAMFSNYGDIDFVAGGVDVFSTYLNNGYAKLSGTSMACPAIVGAAALILSDGLSGKNPRKLSPSELIEKLRKICYDIGPEGYDQWTGHGIPFFTAHEEESIVTKQNNISWFEKLILGIKKLLLGK